MDGCFQVHLPAALPKSGMQRERPFAGNDRFGLLHNLDRCCQPPHRSLVTPDSG